MLLKNEALDAIWAQRVDVVFRRWKRPTVKTGGTLRTRRGMLDIIEVTSIPQSAVTMDDVHRAGFPSKRALIASVSGRPGALFRIHVRPGGVDPLVALRERTELEPAEWQTLESRLGGFDERSSNGPWTRQYLDLLAENPRIRAEDLAESIGLDKPTFKGNVRKLKQLGLTISHSPGYELSPLGHAVRSRSPESR